MTGKKRAGRGRKKANTISYHGIVITGSGNSPPRNFMYNVNNIFSNYATRGKFTNISDPLVRSVIYKAIMYIIKKRREEINREKSELNKVSEKNVSVRKRYERKIEIHEKMIDLYNKFAKFYKGTRNYNTRSMFSIWRVNSGKRVSSVQNGGYRYYAIAPSKNPQKIN